MRVKKWQRRGPLRWKRLTPPQQERARAVGLTNGCGPKWKWLPVPEWFFAASCDHHDFNYWLGGTKRDRARADREFYLVMLMDAERATSWAQRWWLRRMAWLYYRSVRTFGGKLFALGDVKGWADLEAVLEIEMEACSALRKLVR